MFTCACKSGYDLAADRRNCVRNDVNRPKVEVTQIRFNAVDLAIEFESDQALNHVHTVKVKPKFYYIL